MRFKPLPSSGNSFTEAVTNILLGILLEVSTTKATPAKTSTLAVSLGKAAGRPDNPAEASGTLPSKN